MADHQNPETGPYLVVLVSGQKVYCGGFGIDANGICTPHGTFMHIPPAGYVFSGLKSEYVEPD